MIYSESDLILPTLKLLYESKGGLTTTRIIEELIKNLDISESDLEILPSRSDTRFSQKVRNLVSHKTLTSKGLAIYEKSKKSGEFRLTEKGEAYIIENTDSYSYLINSGFEEADRKEVIDKDFGNLIIEEGYMISTSQKEKRKRSRRLTEIARKHYSTGGKLSCIACEFTFNYFYGETACSYIEIHHLKPIFTYEESDTSLSLKDALDNVKPLCSNCHRMIHRNPQRLLSIEELKGLVAANGIHPGYTRL